MGILEEHYLGHLHLPAGNFVSDGYLIFAIAFIITGITGTDIYLNTFGDISWLGIDGVTQLTVGWLLTFLMTLIAVPTMIRK